MLNKRHIISELLKASGTIKNPDVDKAAEEMEGLSGKVISFESGEAGMLKVNGLENAPILNKITMDTENALNSAIAKLSTEGFNYELSAAQQAAVLGAAKYVSSKKGLSKAMGLMSDRTLNYKTIDGREVSLESLDVSHVIGSDDLKQMALSLEAFDPQKIENSIRYSMVVNFMCARQDEFSEAFFPTITIDTINSGFRMDVESFDFVTDFTREIDGSIDDDKFNRKSLVKAQYDNELLLKDYNLVFPIYRKGTNDTQFLSKYTWIEKVGDEEVTVAPLTIGAKHNLLGLSQTEKTLQSGLFTNTDSLDRRIELKHLYVEISGKDKQSQPVTEVFRLVTEGLASAIFQSAPIGNSKDMTLNFSSTILGLNTSNTTTVDGSVSQILEPLTDNHSVELEVIVSGTANPQNGTIAVYGNSISVRKIRNSSGKEIDREGETYKAIVAALANIKIIGFDVNAGRTNSNLRTRGQRIEVNRYSEMYPVPVRSDINIELPIDLSTGDESDIALVDAQVTAIGAYCSAHAVDTIIKMANKLREMKTNGTLGNIDRFEGISVGRYYVDGYYYAESIDVSAQMDSREANQRFNDVRSFLIDKIYNMVVDMAIESKYLQVFKQMYSKESKGVITAIVGTDPAISKFLLAGCESNIIPVGPNYQLMIVDTPNPRVKGKVFISFTIMDEGRNTTVNALNFGQMLWSPAIVLDLSKPEGNAYTRTIRSIPRYWHQVNLPIMIELTIADTKNAFNKNTLNIKNV